MADRMLAVNADSTVELPSEPDPGSAGSSSCVSNFSRYMSVRSTFVVLTESSNFNTTTPHGPSSCDELSGSEGATGESMECAGRPSEGPFARAPCGPLMVSQDCT